VSLDLEDQSSEMIFSKPVPNYRHFDHEQYLANLIAYELHDFLCSTEASLYADSQMLRDVLHDSS